MGNRNEPRKQGNPVRQGKGAFGIELPTLEHFQKAQKVERVADSVVRGILWLGYGFALVSWFVAVNGVILFSQILKIK